MHLILGAEYQWKGMVTLCWLLCSGLEHQEEDWLSIHEKLCPIITVLRSPQTHANTEEERQHRHQQQLLRKVP